MTHAGLATRLLSSCIAVLLAACAGASSNPDGGSVGDGKLGLKDSSWDYQAPFNPEARPQRCDENGQNCKCMNIVSLGQVARYGNPPNSDSTDAFKTWLNTNSNANLTLLTTRTTITPEFLAGYDIVILQDLESSPGSGSFWTFSQDEIDALSNWVQQGNGLITMTGYGGDSREVIPTNQLLAFSGLSYATSPDTFTDAGQNAYCHGNSAAFSNWAASSWITYNMKNSRDLIASVGIFHGRPITCDDQVGGSPCDVVAIDAVAGVVGAGKQVGKGRVFVWSDEWVTYSSQWKDTEAHGAECNNYLASTLFNCPQFWYNIIHWSLPDASCFNLWDPQVIP